MYIKRVHDTFDKSSNKLKFYSATEAAFRTEAPRRRMQPLYAYNTYAIYPYILVYLFIHMYTFYVLDGIQL